MNTVCPSGAAWATACAAMKPLAPALFSTITGFPVCFETSWASARANPSVVLPEVMGTTKLIVLPGNACAWAGALHANTRYPNASQILEFNSALLSAIVFALPVLDTGLSTYRQLSAGVPMASRQRRQDAGQWTTSRNNQDFMRPLARMPSFMQRQAARSAAAGSPYPWRWRSG